MCHAHVHCHPCRPMTHLLATLQHALDDVNTLLQSCHITAPRGMATIAVSKVKLKYCYCCNVCDCWVRVCGWLFVRKGHRQPCPPGCKCEARQCTHGLMDMHLYDGVLGVDCVQLQNVWRPHWAAGPTCQQVCQVNGTEMCSFVCCRCIASLPGARGEVLVRLTRNKRAPMCLSSPIHIRAHNRGCPYTNRAHVRPTGDACVLHLLPRYHNLCTAAQHHLGVNT
jgi:hypothetical protein